MNCKEWIEKAKAGDANLRNADLSGADLSGADLSGADFSYADLSDADLSGADLSGADFSYADLRDADLSDADLRNANLSDANLTDADLRNARHPKAVKVESLFSKIKSGIDAGGVLEMGAWHNECRTTHCMAGWAVTIAGERAIGQEDFASTPYIAALIIKESCPYLKGKTPNFYATNEEAMKFIDECAEIETAIAKKEV